MQKTLILCLAATLVAAFVPARVYAQEKVEERVTALENSVKGLERTVDNHGRVGGVLFLYAVFCALWAQNTGRSAWLWFFLGLFFSVITAVALLIKNADDRKHRRREEQPVETGA